MSDSGGNSSQKKATLFSLTAEHDKRSASSSESGQQASSVNLDSGYEGLFLVKDRRNSILFILFRM